MLRYLADALDAAGVTPETPSWQDFVAAMSGLSPPLRVLDPGGSPANGRSIAVVGGAGPVTLSPSHLGDALAALGISRADLAAGVTLDVSGDGSPIASAEGTAHSDGRVPVTGASTLVTAATLEDWLSPQQSAALARFTRGNTVRAFVDGVATYADLFAELDDAVTAGADGAFYVTGYSLQHDAKIGPADAPRRTVAEVARAMAEAGGDPRFLALQMLQLEPGVGADDRDGRARIAAMLLAIAGAAATAFQTDSAANQASFFLHAEAIAAALFIGSVEPGTHPAADRWSSTATRSTRSRRYAGVEAHLDPVDADVDDNPPRGHVGRHRLGGPVARSARFNVFHQKIQVVRNAGGIHAYCGGIDLNANRTSDPGARVPLALPRRPRPRRRPRRRRTRHHLHRALAAERPTTTLALDAPGALDGLPTDGPRRRAGRADLLPADGRDSGRGFSFRADTARAPSSTRSSRRSARRGATSTSRTSTSRRRRNSAKRWSTRPRAVSGPAHHRRASQPRSAVRPAPPPGSSSSDMAHGVGRPRSRSGSCASASRTRRPPAKSASGRLWLAEDSTRRDDIIELAPPRARPRHAVLAHRRQRGDACSHARVGGFEPGD